MSLSGMDEIRHPFDRAQGVLEAKRSPSCPRIRQRTDQPQADADIQVFHVGAGRDPPFPSSPGFPFSRE
jgi:hypothetical protein